MGEFTCLPPGEKVPTRHHRRTRSYDVVIPLAKLNEVAGVVRQAARDMWTGRELERLPDGYTRIRLTYGPVLNNTAYDIVAKILVPAQFVRDDPSVSVEPVSRGRCAEDCPQPRGHYDEEV